MSWGQIRDPFWRDPCDGVPACRGVRQEGQWCGGSRGIWEHLWVSLRVWVAWVLGASGELSGGARSPGSSEDSE